MKGFFLTIFICTLFFTEARSQYGLLSERTDRSGDTIHTYTVGGDSVTGKIKNGMPVGVWTHYYFTGSYMKGLYKGSLGQYTGKWDYFSKEGLLIKSIIYHSEKIIAGQRHTKIHLDSAGARICEERENYTYGGLTDSQRIYRFIQGKKVLVYKDLYSMIRIVEKEYSDNGKLKFKANPSRMFNTVIYKKYSEEGRLMEKKKEKYLTKMVSD